MSGNPTNAIAVVAPKSDALEMVYMQLPFISTDASILPAEI
jgi:hypothetical protein